jgi:hypothetical protein
VGAGTESLAEGPLLGDERTLKPASAFLSRLASGLSALAPAQRAGAQRLCALGDERTLTECNATSQFDP